MLVNFSLLRRAALFEGTSLLVLLFIAVPLKYMANLAIAVKVVGPIHGLLFISFIGILYKHAFKRDLSMLQTLIGTLASFIPFGSFIFKAKVLPTTVYK